MQLRDYQKEVVRQISKAYQDDQHKGVILRMETGAGKTKTAAYIVERYASTQRQVLWLVHREELLLQAAMTFAEIGVHHRMICAKSSERAAKAEQFREFGHSYVNDAAYVIVCSVQTLVRRLDQVSWLNPSQIIADECHLSLNKTFRTIIAHFPEARLLGLTATPAREDGQSFDRSQGGLYDDMIEGPSMSWLIENGMLCDYQIYAPPIQLDMSKKVRTKGGDYDAKDLAAQFDKPVIFGDVVEHYRKYAHKLPAIGFCPTIEIADKFTDEFKKAGYNAVSLNGNTDDVARRRALKGLENGTVDIVMSVDILIEGTDVPLATVAICLRRTKSVRIYKQSIGRVLRPHPNKSHAIIFDFVGLTELHGYPDDEREWGLDGRVKRKRKESEADEEPEIKILSCPKCFAKHKPEPTCPRCGHEYTPKERAEIKVVEGALSVISNEERMARRAQIEQEKRIQQYERKTQEGQCKTYDDFYQLGVSRGYQFPAAWAKKRMQARANKGAE